jgi:hypothetical protein
MLSHGGRDSRQCLIACVEASHHRLAPELNLSECLQMKHVPMIPTLRPPLFG